MTSTLAISLQNVSKSFGWTKKVQAVQNLTLEVEQGQVFGFLGPNGAGKTTTIRMILELIRPSAGQIYLFGKSVQQERQVLGRVGAQVEYANFYPFLTGRRNLEVFALTANLKLTPAEIDRLLDDVNMTPYALRRVGGYSTGMKQRLGLAATLLNNPDLIILDEPTNGLDPQGIQDMRHFIRELVDQHGKTVFLSSHLLNEVEQVCDRVAIINYGQILREGSVADLVAQNIRLRLKADPLEKAVQILQEHWRISHQQDDVCLLAAKPEDAPAIVEKLVNAGLKVYEITPQRQTLEEYFLTVTGTKDVDQSV